jgi:hypothetical protein
MANNPIRINIHKSQLELVERCLSASSLPTKAALFSHFLTLYSEDYLRRFGAVGKPLEPNLTEAIKDERKPPKPFDSFLQEPTGSKGKPYKPSNHQNTPFVEIIED